MDNNDFMPWPNWGNNYGPGSLHKPVSGRAPDPLKSNEWQYIEAGLYWPYLKQRQGYNFPLDRTNPGSWVKRVPRLVRYILSGAVCGVGRFDKGGAYQLGAGHPAGYGMWGPGMPNFGRGW